MFFRLKRLEEMVSYMDERVIQLEQKIISLEEEISSQPSRLANGVANELTRIMKLRSDNEKGA